MRGQAQASGEDVNNPTTQLDFIANELKTRPEGKAFMESQDPQQRQAALMQYFRPAGWTPQTPQAGDGYAQRVQYGQQFAGAQPNGPQAPPQQTGPTFDPGSRLEALGKQAAQAGDYETAVKFQRQAQEERVKFENTRQGQAAGIALTGAEHDRQQRTATPNNEQSLSAGFSDRMQNSNRLIDRFGPALTNFGARAKDSLPLGLGNLAQSPEFQQAKQAKDDFINAQLRRESGAAIAPSEYANADKQYFPQPGDGPEVLQQKAKNRQLAVEGMVRNAGPTYQPSPSVGAAPAQGGGDVLSQAREAIAQGAPRDKVIERLRAQGINAEGL